MLAYVQRLLNNSRSSQDASQHSSSSSTLPFIPSSARQPQAFTIKSPLMPTHPPHGPLDTSDQETLDRDDDIAKFLNRGTSLQRPRKPKVLKESRSGTSHRMSTIKESPFSEGRFDKAALAKHVYSPIFDSRNTIEESEDEDDIWASETSGEIESRRLAEGSGGGIWRRSTWVVRVITGIRGRAAMAG